MQKSDYHRIAEALRFLETNLEHQPQLVDLARHLGLSEYHLHRMFRKWAGITPKDFLQVLTLAKAKKLLMSSKSILETSLQLGLSGGSRLYDLFIAHEAMTPGEFKTAAAGVTIYWGIYPTPFGVAFFAATERGLCALSFVEDEGDRTQLAEMGKRWPEATFIKDNVFLQPMVNEVERRMKGETNRRIGLFLNGTRFQIKVWEALLTIPDGQVVTYQAIARTLGMPTAARAIGQALATNPIAYLIPCHRVIKTTGAIGLYQWGEERKRVMLAVEGARHHMAKLQHMD